MTDNEALNEALDIAAPDQESWIAGRTAFIATIATGDSTEQALFNALDAAAPDRESWIAARNALVLRGTLELKGDPPMNVRDTIKSLFTGRNHS